MLRRLRQLLDWLRPPPRWEATAILLLGICSGLGAVIFHISRATSYLSDNPATCINCHVMRPQYATWQRGSHGRVATCNDCHVPHDNIFKTYAFKAMDGTRHSWMFTFRLEPQVIRMHEPGVRVVQDNCIRCHADAMGDAVHTLAIAARDARAGRGKLCWECHRETPHGRVKSLTSTPDAQVPLLDNVLPPWLQPLRKDHEQDP